MATQPSSRAARHGSREATGATSTLTAARRRAGGACMRAFGPWRGRRESAEGASPRSHQNAASLAVSFATRWPSLILVTRTHGRGGRGDSKIAAQREASTRSVRHWAAPATSSRWFRCHPDVVLRADFGPKRASPFLGAEAVAAQVLLFGNVGRKPPAGDDLRRGRCRRLPRSPRRVGDSLGRAQGSPPAMRLPTRSASGPRPDGR
jgi:hypothetical protein